MDTSVCIAAQDRAGLERLLRYCARPPFASERLRKAGSELVCRCAKQHSEPGSDRRDKRGAKRGAKRVVQADELYLTPLEQIERLASLVPPPRAHRHRCTGVLAPNSPLWAATTALAAAQAAGAVQAGTAQAEATGLPGMGVAAPTSAPLGHASAPSAPTTPEPAPPKRSAHVLWAVLIARIYEVFPLLCPICGGQMRVIAFIAHSADIRHILEYIGVPGDPPLIASARGPPLWDGCDAPSGEGVQVQPDWDETAQPAPDVEADQRISW